MMSGIKPDAMTELSSALQPALSLIFSYIHRYHDILLSQTNDKPHRMLVSLLLPHASCFFFAMEVVGATKD